MAESFLFFSSKNLFAKEQIDQSSEAARPGPARPVFWAQKVDKRKKGESRFFSRIFCKSTEKFGRWTLGCFIEPFSHSVV